jgi:hypothetical protein
MEQTVIKKGNFHNRNILLVLLGLLFLTSLLLIAATQKIASDNVNTASNASGLSPQYQSPSCNNYEYYFDLKQERVNRLRKELNCPEFTRENYPHDSNVCNDLYGFWLDYNELREFTKNTCNNSCPQSSPTPTISPSPVWWNITVTPTPTMRISPTPTINYFPKKSYTPTPTPANIVPTVIRE